MQHLGDVADATNPLYDKKRKARTRSSRDHPGSSPASLDAVNEEETEWNDSSTLNDDEADSKRVRWTVNMETPVGKKAAKTEKKTIRNQAAVHIITDEDLKLVEDALHPDPIVLSDRRIQNKDSQGLSNNSTIENNITYNSRTFKWPRQGAHGKRLAKAQAITLRRPISHSVQKDESLMASILGRLDLPHTPLTKQRKALDGKLRAAIKADLIAYENEVAETMTRMAGYWRYVNRRTYNAMVQMNEIWDWATGEKLPEFEETELVEEAEVEGAVTGAPAEEEIVTPLPEAYDEDFKFPAGESGFGLASDIETDCEQNPPTPAPVFAFTFRYMATPDDPSPVVNIPPKTLTYNPRRAPRPNLTSAAPPRSSPAPPPFSTKHPAQNAKKTPPTTPVPAKPNPDTFANTKDTRILNKAIHPASTPPQPSPPPKQNPSPRLTLGASLPETHIPGGTGQLHNSFGALSIETPAPREIIEITAAAPPRRGGRKARSARAGTEAPVAKPPAVAVLGGLKAQEEAFPALPAVVRAVGVVRPRVRVLNILAPVGGGRGGKKLVGAGGGDEGGGWTAVVGKGGRGRGR